MQDSFSYFINQLINGVSLGAIYGLIAIGYTMVYGIIGMINFAHGDIFMIGAFIALMAFMLLGMADITWVPLAIMIVLLLSMVLTSVYGWSIERIAYRPLRASPRLAPLITAIGMSIFLQNYVQMLQGARPRPMPSVVKGDQRLWTATTPEGGEYAVSISNIQLFSILAMLVLVVGFTYIITRTPLGRAQRACEQDRGMAALLGVNVDRTISLTFVIGALLAAVAGMIFLMRYGAIDFYIGFQAGIKSFTAAVLGGIGSLPGAVLGGLLIGLIEALFSGYLTVDYKDVAVFAVLVLVLIFRPTGLLGRPDIEKV